ncbi:ATP-binding protein [Nonomuraea purpurea]|uniref:ATP-binding protein n=1 Tax=Nonomuraea purpurea TaxID=1849276 RepID=A0ABV8G7I4_9ACTN
MTSHFPHELDDTLSRAFTLSPIPPSIPVARKWVRQMLDRWGLEALRPPVEWLVTELTTNAIKHARTGGATVTVLVMYTAGTLRIEVRDRDPDNLPIRRQSTSEAESGRGLLIVEEYADRWNVRVNERGKTVWCELDMPCVRQAVAQ